MSLKRVVASSTTVSTLPDATLITRRGEQYLSPSLGIGRGGGQGVGG